MDIIWINPVVKGSCTPRACGGACCKGRKYFDPENYTDDYYCPHFNIEQFICNIYETRPYGCRVYPSPDSLIKEKHAGCGYYLEEQT
jgi:Fe-S-cluster containining protein